MPKLNIFNIATYLKTESDVKLFIESAFETKKPEYISSAIESVKNILGHDGKPKFMILPFDEYQSLLEKSNFNKNDT